LQDFLQDEGDSTRLARAGRAEHGKVLAQQLLEIDVGGNRRIEAQAADLNGLAAINVMDRGNVADAEADDGAADGRISRDATVEAGIRLSVALDLAHEIDLGD